jgi:hypothetical protein
MRKNERIGLQSQPERKDLEDQEQAEGVSRPLTGSISAVRGGWESSNRVQARPVCVIVVAGVSSCSDRPRNHLNRVNCIWSGVSR